MQQNLNIERWREETGNLSNKKHKTRQNQLKIMSELQKVSLVFLKIFINDLSSGVRNRTSMQQTLIWS